MLLARALSRSISKTQVPNQFRESREVKSRARWPLAFDLEGVERNTEVRKQLKQQQEAEESYMPQQPSNNRFVSGAAIDLNRPPREPYNPNDPKNQYPKMLYHQTKKDPNWLREHKRLTLYNSLHPEKPELLPTVPAAFIVVKNKHEEEAALKDGFALRPPAEEVAEEFADLNDEVLCSRGCGQAPHKGRCKTVAAVA
jgi:hypothetical protein